VIGRTICRVAIPLALICAGCASTPEPVARFDTRLAGYFDGEPLERGRHPASSRVGVGVLPSESSGAVAEANRLSMIAAMRKALSSDSVKRSIRPIDDSYLKAGRGLENLRQTGKLFGVDTIFLLSMDQQFRPQESGGLVRVTTATGPRDVDLPSQALLTYIDLVMVDLASGEAGYARQVISELGVDARTWTDPRLRRQAEADATASALQRLQTVLSEDWSAQKR